MKNESKIQVTKLDTWDKTCITRDRDSVTVIVIIISYYIDANINYVIKVFVL